MPRVDFTSQDYLRDPAGGLTKLRAAGPVIQVRFPIVGKTWITTTNDLAGRVLKDSETFTMRQNGRVAGLRWWMPGWLRTLTASMLTMDEPDHTRLRSWPCWRQPTWPLMPTHALRISISKGDPTATCRSA